MIKMSKDKTKKKKSTGGGVGNSPQSQIEQTRCQYNLPASPECQGSPFFSKHEIKGSTLC